jgi:hypothetical protein
MRIRHLITTSIVCLSVAFAAVAAAPLYGADGLYSVRECRVENRTCRPHPAAYQSVHDIDFRNFAVHLEGENKQVGLSNGHYADDVSRVDLKEVHYLPPNSAGAEHVLLVMSEERTAANPTGEWIAQVLQFSKQQWTVIQEFTVDLYNDAHPAFAHAFDESTKTLLMQFDHLGGAHECGNAAGSRTVKYRWNGSHLRLLPLAQN